MRTWRGKRYAGLIAQSFQSCLYFTYFLSWWVLLVIPQFNSGAKRCIWHHPGSNKYWYILCHAKWRGYWADIMVARQEMLASLGCRKTLNWQMCSTKFALQCSLCASSALISIHSSFYDFSALISWLSYLRTSSCARSAPVFLCLHFSLSGGVL